MDSAHNSREAGVMPPLSESTVGFEGCPVLALDTEQYYDADWFYDSPLPPGMLQEPQLFWRRDELRSLPKASSGERVSFQSRYSLRLISGSTSVGVDDPALGIDGVSFANATCECK